MFNSLSQIFYKLNNKNLMIISMLNQSTQTNKILNKKKVRNIIYTSIFQFGHKIFLLHKDNNFKRDVNV